LATELSVGKLYYMVKYADEALTRPIIATYEYKAKEPKDADDQEYLFEDIASGDELILRECDLWHMVDMPGLIEELKRFHATGKGGAHDAS
jgi:hypothetical protein